MIEYLKAGSPPHWMAMLTALYALLEWYLPRTNSVKARSVGEALANMIGAIVPAVKKVAGTPEDKQ